MKSSVGWFLSKYVQLSLMIETSKRTVRQFIQLKFQTILSNPVRPQDQLRRTEVFKGLSFPSSGSILQFLKGHVEFVTLSGEKYRVPARNVCIRELSH